MMNKKEKVSDCWGTPQDLFDVLDKSGVYQGIKFEGFHFDIDLCATAENSKCETYGSDYIEDCYGDAQAGDNAYAGAANNISDMVELFNGELCCFMNPPYSNPRSFIQKAWKDSKYCKIVCLVKCDPSTKWWATFWDYDYCIACESAPCIRDRLSCECEANHMRGPKPGCEVIFFPKRVRFTPPNRELLRKDTLASRSGARRPGPTFASALVIMDRRGLRV